MASQEQSAAKSARQTADNVSHLRTVQRARPKQSRAESAYAQEFANERERSEELEQEIENLKMDLGWAKRDLVWFREQCNKLLQALENKIEPERSLQEIQSNETSYAAAVALLQSAKKGLRQASGVLRHGYYEREDRVGQLERQLTEKEEKLESMRQELAKLLPKLTALAAERDAARETASRLQLQCKELQQQLAEASSLRANESLRVQTEHAYFEQRLREVSSHYTCLYRSYSSLYHQYMSLGFPAATMPHMPSHTAAPQYSPRPYPQHWPPPPPPPPTPDWWPGASPSGNPDLR